MAGVNVIFARDAVHKLLARVAAVSPASATIPLLSHILVEHTDNGLLFTATDLDVWLSASAPAQGKRFAAFCVPGRLAEIVAHLPAGSQVNLATPKDAEADDAVAVEVISGRSRFSLPILPAADFPPPPEPRAVQIDIAAGALQDLLARTRWAAGKEENRYYLNGVFFDRKDEDQLRATATDGHRLARCEGPRPAGLSGLGDIENGGIIVPSRTVDILHSMMEGTDATVALNISADALSAEMEPWRVVSKLIDGTFPDADRVFPTDMDALCPVDVQTSTLKEALARVALVTTDAAHAITISGAKGALVIDATSSDGSRAHEEIDASWHRKPTEEGVAFNSKYLKQLLGGMGGETLTLMLGKGDGPSLVKVAGREGLVALIMPCRA